MKKAAIFILLFISHLINYAQLDQNMNQSISIPGMEFKALAGQQESGVRLNTAYQNKFPGIPASFTTYFANLDGKSKKLKLGYGLNLSSTDIGRWAVNHSYIETYVNRSFNIKGKLELIPSFNISANQRKIDWSKMTLSDQLPYYTFLPNTPNTDKISYLSIGLGTALKADNFHFAVNLDRLNTPNISMYNGAKQNLPIAIAATSGYRFDLSEKWHFAPRFTYRKWSEFQQFNLALNITRNNFTLAGSYDFGDYLNLAFGYIIKNKVSLNYNYAWSTAPLGYSLGGIHELGISLWLFKGKESNSTFNQIGLL